MTDFFKKPYLPDKKVTLALCGKIDEKLSGFIKSFGIELIFSKTNTELDAPISNHIDLIAHHMGGNEIIIDRNQSELYKILLNYGIRVYKTEKAVKSPYPFDCLLNCFRIGDYLFCNTKSNRQIMNMYKSLKTAEVNQGYCKCSTLLTDDHSFITDDISIYHKGKEFGFDCILIDKGDISLKGYNYGFIGGASAKIDKNIVVFFGDVTKHRSFNKIDLFLKSKGIDYVFLRDFPLTDIGGIIPLK